MSLVYLYLHHRRCGMSRTASARRALEALARDRQFQPRKPL